MTQSLLSPHFPARSFVSQVEFDDYCRENQSHLDARYAYETGLATDAAFVQRRGTCAPCLRPTLFTARTAGGEQVADGRRMPKWREELVCDCEDRLGARPRALLHFLGSVAAAQPWSRALLLGPPTLIDRRVSAMVGQTTSVGRLVADGSTQGHRIPVGNAAFHFVISADYLQRVPPLETALAEIRRVLAPGGQFIFTVPFRYRAAATRSVLDVPQAATFRLPAEAAGEFHGIGWDILGRLRASGFVQATAHVYWSRELGYLGPFNMIFSALA